MKRPVESDLHFDFSYDYLGRFTSYWYQINEIVSLHPRKVLEVGIGNGLVSSYLKKGRVDLTTVDIDERLHPDVVANVFELPFPDKSFDLVACYEVLEHLPYEDFPTALQEISRVSSSHIVLSLPDESRFYCLFLQLPRITVIKKVFSPPRLIKKRHVFDGEHHWEIGKRGYSLKKIIGNIQGVGLSVDKTFRVFENPGHRFFVLSI